MAGIKHRQRVVSGGGMIFGSTTFSVASMTNASNVVATATISGLVGGEELFVQPYAGMSGCIVLSSACTSSTGISACITNTSGSSVSACTTASVYYFALPG